MPPHFDILVAYFLLTFGTLWHALGLHWCPGTALHTALRHTTGRKSRACSSPHRRVLHGPCGATSCLTMLWPPSRLPPRIRPILTYPTQVHQWHVRHPRCTHQCPWEVAPAQPPHFHNANSQITAPDVWNPPGAVSRRSGGRKCTSFTSPSITLHRPTQSHKFDSGKAGRRGLQR